MLVLESEAPEPPELELEAALSVVHLNGEDMVVMAGDEAITASVKDRLFRVSAASFFQVNTAMAGRWRSTCLTIYRFLPDNPAGCLLWRGIVQFVFCWARSDD